VTRIAILQSNYLPWKGYFDVVAQVDAFYVYDCAQYTRSDWRNRNQIKTPTGKRWLTVPVIYDRLGKRIDETRIADRSAVARHWDMLRGTYRGAPAYHEACSRLAPLFEAPVPEMLSTLNRRMIDGVCEFLNIRTPIFDCGTIELRGGRNDRLIQICRDAGATRYLSGPAARSYLDVDAFARAGIRVEWMQYEGYPEYAQPHPPFDHRVSVVDLLFCTGEEAARYMLHSGVSLVG
jgi:hypothetical protein